MPLASLSRLLQVLLPALGLGAFALGASAGEAAVPLRPSAPASAPTPAPPPPSPPPRVDERQLPIVLQARELQARPDLDALAVGEAELRRGSLFIRADRLSYDVPEDLARAVGQVVVRREDTVYRGPEMQMKLQRYEGFFLQPEFDLLRLKSGGRADRVDFIGSSRAVATRAAYTSCPREDMDSLPWVLQADRVRMDFDANEGVAEGGVLRFMDVPILALPVLSFPLSDDRKSGWLPPGLNIDSRSGLEVAVPYYWNIAPNRDATFTPRVMTRRGLALDSEFRYLAPALSGQLNLDWVPDDRVALRSRHALSWRHQGTLEGPGLRYSASLDRVSDDAWWVDFPGTARVITPRLLPQRLALERDLPLAAGSGLAYARVQRWQVLQQATDPLTPPFQRSPQLGVQAQGRSALGLEWSGETEFNRFTLPERPVSLADARSPGERWHVVGALALPWRGPAWWLTPRAAFNAAAYRTERAMDDGQRSASRFIPTFSLDAGLLLERQAHFFGQSLRQTLEPRLRYVRTPYRDQLRLPNFDAAERDLNFESIFADNRFAGIDRVSDSHQVTVGVTSRWIDAVSGGELLRLGAVQRVLLDTQRITGNGLPLEERFSDLTLLGRTTVIPHWALDSTLQYSTEIKRLKSTVTSVRYFPGEFRTLSATYRFAREQSEHVDLGWQWPLRLSAAAPSPSPPPQAGAWRAPAAGGCGGAWYSVGRVSYSRKESRITDSVIGFEYDAGCWIGRVVTERLSTGRSEATTRLLLQLELVGLSRLGTNPLKVLKDNIPGYRLLREETRAPPTPPPYE